MAAPLHLPQLTIWRGLAATLVIISHSIRGASPLESGRVVNEQSTYLSAFDLGSFGVVIFLTLSGTTLYLGYRDMSIQRDSIARFYLRRIFRLGSAFAVSILAYLVFRDFFKAFYPEPAGHWIEGQFLIPYSIADLMSYLFFYSNILGERYLFNNAYWSLAIEFQCYLVFPLLLYIIRNKGAVVLSLLGCAVFLMPWLVPVEENLFFTLFLAFVGGVIVGKIRSESEFRILPIHSVILSGLVLLLASFASMSLLPIADFPIIGNIWTQYIVFAVALVLIQTLTEWGEPKGWLSGLAMHLGNVSYSLYLVHNLFVAIAFLLLAQFDWMSTVQRFWFILLFTLTSSIAVASCMYKYVELPFMKIGRTKKNHTANALSVS